MRSVDKVINGMLVGRRSGNPCRDAGYTSPCPNQTQEGLPMPTGYTTEKNRRPNSSVAEADTSKLGEDLRSESLLHGFHLVTGEIAAHGDVERDVSFLDAETRVSAVG
jgi:hypothetical protein